ncbi:MAG: (Fe-S)-binding protein [Bacteroidota bacterium]
MNYDPFIWPFSIGAIILFFTLLIKYGYWIFKLDTSEKLKIVRGFFSIKLIKAIREVFLESLIHRKIFKENALLGYMHMSLAFGWFLLIIGGTIENKIHSHKAFNAPYEPIFFKFFNHNINMYPWVEEFKFIMDFILLLVLSGLVLALIKRVWSRLFGMKKTTRLKTGDRFALISLWLIFPLRFFAESITSGLYNSGGFLTGNMGKALAGIPYFETLYYPSWWAYSSVLCIFFMALPFSRYMHIFTEIVLIFLRNFGIKSCKVFNAFSAVEVYSCSRCGLCIDKCPLLVSARIKDTQGVYFLQSVRSKKIIEDKAFDCLLCGRCQEFCPVGIGLNNIRVSHRLDFAPGFQDYSYLNVQQKGKASVAYFAGCMTHLTPTIKIAMEEIFRKSGTDYVFLDKEGGICCGRPLMLSGEIMKAHKLIEKNNNIIKDSLARTLVTSCPICLKSFIEDYKLNIEVLHHSQYLLRLVNEGKIKLNKTEIRAVYHDPCELGRGCGIYSEPRQLLSKALVLQRIQEEKESSMCCGNSVGGFQLNAVQRDAIRMDASAALIKYNPDLIVTSCPLCKKTFAKDTITPIKDIAEVVASSIV